MALTRLLDVMDKSKELLETLKVPQKTESKFNVFLACKVIQPLTGGTCIINSVKDEDKVAMTNSDVKLPDDFGLTGIAMGMVIIVVFFVVSLFLYLLFLVNFLISYSL